MGQELAAQSPVFAARLGECGQALARYVDWSLGDVLAGARWCARPGRRRGHAAGAVERHWCRWARCGRRPVSRQMPCSGHSQGEIAAATVAGALSLDDAARVVALRSRALSALEGDGGMISVVMPEPAVRELLARWDDRLAVAAVNEARLPRLCPGIRCAGRVPGGAGPPGTSCAGRFRPATSWRTHCGLMSWPGR